MGHMARAKLVVEINRWLYFINRTRDRHLPNFSAIISENVLPENVLPQGATGDGEILHGDAERLVAAQEQGKRPNLFRLD